MTRIETRDSSGKVNGWLATLWHADQGPKIEQVYITAVAPGCMKGAHLHLIRRGLFYLVSGEGSLVIRANTDGDDAELQCWQDGHYIERISMIHYGYHEFKQPHGVVVPPRFPAALYNTGTVDAVFLNMPSPPWRADDPDEHPVEDWDFKL